MKPSRLFPLMLVLILLASLTGGAGGAPLAGPCVPGAAYDPACDADRDGDVDIFDIQLTAGHWNQTGAYVSDNNHNHFGQTWTGTNNPLKLTGSFGGSINIAPLALSNTAGSGLNITSVTEDYGVYVDSAGWNGVYVNQAGEDAVFVVSATYDGVFVDSVGDNGVRVNSTGDDGVDVRSAGGDGVYANTTQANGEWGFYTPDKIYAGTALASNGPLLLVAQSGDSNRLETGDLVVVSGTGTTLGESESPLPLVRRASPGDGSVMGVVYRRFVAAEKVEETTRNGQVERQTRLDTHSAEGPVAPGDTLLVVVLGSAQVKIDGATPIVAGQPLTVATDGRARALGTIKVQLAGDAGTADLPEGAPVIGVAMGAVQDGLVWVMVNPQ